MKSSEINFSYKNNNYILCILKNYKNEYFTNDFIFTSKFKDATIYPVNINSLDSWDIYCQNNNLIRISYNTELRKLKLNKIKNAENR